MWLLPKKDDQTNQPNEWTGTRVLDAHGDCQPLKAAEGAIEVSSHLSRHKEILLQMLYRSHKHGKNVRCQ